MRPHLPTPTDKPKNEMKTKLTFQKSDRMFQVWEYQVSHGHLLIRSPISPGDGTSPACHTNIDLRFVGVDYMAVPRHFPGLEIVRPTHDETRQVEFILGKSIPENWVWILASGGMRFTIVACGFTATENDWDIFESPIEDRSHYRAEP
jgi:hypothetical protein